MATFSDGYQNFHHPIMFRYIKEAYIPKFIQIRRNLKGIGQVKLFVIRLVENNMPIKKISSFNFHSTFTKIKLIKAYVSAHINFNWVKIP